MATKKKVVEESVESIPVQKGVLTAENKIAPEHIEELLAKSVVKTCTYFGTTLVVAVKLPNGYVIVESSSCIDPKNYDRDLGKQICMDRIRDRIWALEGYVGRNEFACK